jgi:hypothetical protein
MIPRCHEAPVNCLVGSTWERRPVAVKRIARLGIYSCGGSLRGNAAQSAPHIEDEHDMNGREGE